MGKKKVSKSRKRSIPHHARKPSLKAKSKMTKRGFSSKSAEAFWNMVEDDLDQKFEEEHERLTTARRAMKKI